jgi:hypothetical protein
MSILACAIAACGAEPSVATSNAVGTTTVSVSAPAVSPAQHALKLAGQADGTAVAATLAEARRQKLTDVEISKAQSFRVVDGARQVATVLTGHGDMPDAIAAGCFIAIQQRGDVELIPTLGYGNYEAETCGGPLAVGIVSSAPVRFGIVFRGYSREAKTSVPMVVEWNRSDNTLLIDDAVSTKALDGGATSIAAMRRLIGRP